MQSGDVLADRFRIEQMIGEGGIGRVFRARDLRTQGPVAIKSLRPEYAKEPRIRRRFMREARAVRRLVHPNIVQMFTYGESGGGVPYIVMELLEGVPLSELREPGLPLEELLTLVDQTLSALALSHGRGIIHRDVKPENIVVCRPDPAGPPVAKLLDFGFARVDDDADPRLTQVHGDAFGTPQYMAPEQASGKGQIGPPTDVYAIGVILYEFLAGHPPFTGAHGMAVALKHLMEEVPPLRPRAGTTVPPGLEAVVQRALRKEPHERYATASDMRRALGPFRGEPVEEEEERDDTLVSDAAANIARIVGEAAVVGTARNPPVRQEARPAERPTGAMPVFVDAAAPPEPEQRPLVGRDEDLLWLWERVRVVCEHRGGRVVLLGAAPGLGKSHLVGWLRDQVAEGGWMLGLGGVHGPEGALDRGGLRGALDGLFGQLPEERGPAERQVRDIVLRWGALSDRGPETLDAVGVSALVSCLRPVRVGSRMASDAGVEVRGDVLFGRICDALRLAAHDRPILLTLEGVQRAGPETLGFLRHLALYLRRQPFPILVVATFATGADDLPEAPEVQAAVEAVARSGGPVERYQLRPLAPAAVAELLAAEASLEGSIAEAIVRRTGGNPFFARELLLLLRQSGELVERQGRLGLAPQAKPDRWPTDLPTTLLRRAQASVRRLEDAPFVQRALELAVVLGEAFDYGLLVDYLMRTTLADELRVERAIEALLSAQLLVEARDVQLDRLHFAHPLLRRALDEHLEAQGATAELRYVAAEAMVAHYAPATAPVAADIAAHYQAAGHADRAAVFYVEAATHARDGGQIKRAFDLLEAGDALLARSPAPEAQEKRASLWLDLGELELLRGGFPRAQNLASRVLAWARKRTHAFLEGRAMLLLSELLRRQGSLPEAARGYAQAGSAFQRNGDRRGMARCLLGRALVERGLGRQDVAAQLFEQARAAMAAVDDVLGSARACRGLGELALRRGDFETARDALDQARRQFGEVGDRAGATFCEWLLGETQRHLLAPDVAMIHFEAARRGYASLGDHGGLARCHGSLGRLYADRGDWERASAHLQHAVAAFEAQGDAPRAARALEELGLMALGHRDFELAAECLEAALAQAIATQDAAREVVLRACLAWSAAERGDQRTCGAQLERALLLDQNHRVLDDDLARALERIAEVDAYLGNARRAAVLLERALEIHQSLGDRAQSQRVHLALASLGRVQ